MHANDLWPAGREGTRRSSGDLDTSKRNGGSTAGSRPPLAHGTCERCSSRVCGQPNGKQQCLVAERQPVSPEHGMLPRTAAQLPPSCRGAGPLAVARRSAKTASLVPAHTLSPSHPPTVGIDHEQKQCHLKCCAGCAGVPASDRGQAAAVQDKPLPQAHPAAVHPGRQVPAGGVRAAPVHALCRVFQQLQRLTVHAAAAVIHMPHHLEGHPYLTRAQAHAGVRSSSGGGVRAACERRPAVGLQATDYALATVVR